MYRALLLSVVLFIGSVEGLADIERCRSDVLNDMEKASGRNHWAKKCGYINQQQEELANQLNMYWTFTSGQQPYDGSAPCLQGLQLQGLCPKGCFSGSQKVMFANQYMGIAEAYEKRLESVTALTSDLQAEEVSIKDFVIGDTAEELLRFRTAGGLTIEVTKNHPMVKDDGLVVRADSLKVGDSLLDESLAGDKILKVERFFYRGKVWNVLLESDEKANNLIFSEGLVTGSMRFQNQWADETYRLSLREHIHVPSSQN